MEQRTGFHLFTWPHRWLLAGPALATRRHRHHAAQISIGLDGPVSMRTDPASAWISSPCLYVPPDLSHEFDAGESRAVFMYLCPEAVECRHLCRRYGNDSIATLSLPSVAATRLQRLSVPDGDATEAEHACQVLLGDAAGQYRRTLDARLRHVIEHIDDNLAKPVRLADLAHTAAVSESWLSHAFGREIGIPLRRYLLWRRLRHAVERALAGQSLTGAAHEAGFADSAHLSRTFRETFGVTPTFLLDPRVELTVTDCPVGVLP